MFTYSFCMSSKESPVLDSKRASLSFIYYCSSSIKTIIFCGEKTILILNLSLMDLARYPNLRVEIWIKNLRSLRYNYCASRRWLLWTFCSFRSRSLGAVWSVWSPCMAHGLFQSWVHWSLSLSSSATGWSSWPPPGFHLDNRFYPPRLISRFFRSLPNRPGLTRPCFPSRPRFCSWFLFGR